MEKENKKLLKTLTLEESKTILSQFDNSNNVIYKNDSESSLKQMMRFLNENEIVTGNQKLGKEVNVELYKSSILSNLKRIFNNVLYQLSDNSSYINVRTKKYHDTTIDFENTFNIKIYESNANIGFYENIEMLFGNLFNNKKSLKTEFLNYVLSHEYGHLKHLEWQKENELFCPLKDRKSLFLNLLTPPELVKRASIIDMQPDFMRKEKWVRDRNILTFNETFADIYSLIALNNLYSPDKNKEMRNLILARRYESDKLGSSYKTMEAIEEFMEFDHSKLQDSASINEYLMDISTRNGFKHFINKYNQGMEIIFNSINKSESFKDTEGEKCLFLEIAFIIGGLIPNADNNNFIDNMKILEEEFGINFPFKNNQEYMNRVLKNNELGINLYMKAGEVRGSVISGEKGLLINVINNKSDKDLINDINKRILFIESYDNYKEDMCLDYTVNREMASIFYITGFLAEKEAIKNKVNTEEYASYTSKKYRDLLNNINIDIDKIEDIDLSLLNSGRKKLGIIDGYMNEEYFDKGRDAAKKMYLNMKNNLSLSSLCEKLENRNTITEQTNLIVKKGIKLN
ncbi:TPA: hypothetical protein NV714_003530 [Escherichia coli]|nr:hypothetical protein [Escherichia coli]